LLFRAVSVLPLYKRGAWNKKAVLWHSFLSLFLLATVF
jgi:hypothetical protein